MKVCLVVSKRLGFLVLQEIHKMVDDIVEVITCDDREDSNRTCFEELQKFCNSESITFHVMTNKQLCQHIKNTKPKLCFVCGWYWILPKSVLDQCEMGCLGIHNSLLPKFRGGAPLIWSMIAGSKEIGSSLFLFGEGMDDGPLLHQWKVTVDEEDFLPDIQQKIESKILGNIGSLFHAYLTGSLTPFKQSTFDASYCAQRKPADSKINWKQSSKKLYSECKALQAPYPLLHFFHKDSKYQIQLLKPSKTVCYGKPGKVVAKLPEGILVSVGEGKEGVLLVKILNSDGTAIPIEKLKIHVGAEL